MGGIIFLDFLYAVGMALSPTPIVMVILMLFGPNGRRNALAFWIGWVIGLGILAAVLYGLTRTGTGLLEANGIFSRPTLQILIGLGIILLAYKQWNKPPKQTAAGAAPKWLGSLEDWLTKSSDKFTPRRALALAIVMSAASLKNIALMLAVVLAITQANLDAAATLILFVFFVLLSSVTIGLPVMYALAQGENARQTLEQWKLWVIENRGRAVALLLFTLGIIVTINGVIALSEQLAS